MQTMTKTNANKKNGNGHIAHVNEDTTAEPETNGSTQQAEPEQPLWIRICALIGQMKRLDVMQMKIGIETIEPTFDDLKSYFLTSGRKVVDGLGILDDIRAEVRREIEAEYDKRIQEASAGISATPKAPARSHSTRHRPPANETIEEMSVRASILINAERLQDVSRADMLRRLGYSVEDTAAAAKLSVALRQAYEEKRIDREGEKGATRYSHI